MVACAIQANCALILPCEHCRARVAKAVASAVSSCSCACCPFLLHGCGLQMLSWPKNTRFVVEFACAVDQCRSSPHFPLLHPVLQLQQQSPGCPGSVSVNTKHAWLAVPAIDLVGSCPCSTRTRNYLLCFWLVLVWKNG